MATASEPEVTVTGDGAVVEKRNRLLDAIILAFAAAFILTGIYLAVGRAWLLSDAGEYTTLSNEISGGGPDGKLTLDMAGARAAACPNLSDAATRRDCVAIPTAVVVGRRQVVQDLTVHEYLTFTIPEVGPAPQTFEVAEPSQAYYGLTAGQHIQLRIWEGRLVQGCTNPSPNLCGGWRFADSPLITDRTDLLGGLYGIGMGGLLIVVHPPARLAGVARRRTRWHDDREPADGSLSTMLRVPALRVTFVTVILLEIGDVASSIVDGVHGFYESNQLAVVLITSYGSLGGFLGIKLPATIALFLGVARLPRRLAFIVLLAMVAVMAYIVGQNILLFATGHPASG